MHSAVIAAMLFSERSASSTPLNNQLPVPTRQNSIKSFRSLSSHNGYVQVDQQQQSDWVSSSGGGSIQRLSVHSRQSSFRSVVGSLLFDATSHAAEYQHNDLSPPEQPLTDDLKDELHDCHRDDDTEACCSSSCRHVVVIVVVVVSVKMLKVAYSFSWEAHRRTTERHLLLFFFGSCYSFSY